MKLKSLGMFMIAVMTFLLFSNFASGQEITKTSPGLPENISKIVTVSCMPCHTSKGSFGPRSALNFDEWTSYTPEKQKKKAENMYKQVNKGAMPPKEARENNPMIVLDKSKVDAIKNWADSLK